MLEFLAENKSSWEKIKESKLPVVVYGMGNGADKVIDEFNRLKIPVAGVTASDGFVRGQVFRGFKVRRLCEFEGDCIVAIAFASCLPEVMNHIYSLAREHRVIVPCVPVFGNDIFNREFVASNEEKLNAAYSLFDEKSKEIFAGCVNFMFGGELDVLKSITTEKSEVFNGFLKLGESESYLDLGAYRGDTVEEFLHYCGGKYRSITALEPDPKTYAKLCKYLSDIPNSEAVCKAVYSESGTVKFSGRAGRQSAISLFGNEIETITVDELFKNRSVSYIKADVEGTEAAAIKGAKNTLKIQKPKLNIALYHRSEDIFKLPLQIAAINPDYRFHIRHHPYIPCWDMNLYCV